MPGRHPTVVKITPTYENVYAGCPQCGSLNVYNRVSDLKTGEPISGREVICERPHCETAFWITNDRINPPHEALLFDCRELLDRKQYMQCVLTVTQAYEVFFSHFVNVQVLYRTFAKDGSYDVSRFNALSQELYEAVKKYSFDQMRSLFLGLVSQGTSFASLSDAEAWIGALPEPHRIGKPRRAIIEAISADDLRKLLLAVYDTEASRLRNRVVHKQAYRPTRDEARECVEEARRILLPLTSELDLRGDAGWYLSEPGR